MPFESFHKIQFAVLKNQFEVFRDYLHKKGVVHLKNVSELNQTGILKIDKNYEKIIQQKIEAINSLLQYIESENPTKSSFMDNFIPNRPIVENSDLRKIEDSLDPIQLNQTNLEYLDSYNKINDDYKKIVNILAYLHGLKELPIHFDLIHKLNKISIKFYISNDVSYEDLINHPFISENAIIYDNRENSPGMQVQTVVCTKKIEPELTLLLKKFGMEEFDVSSFHGSIAETYKEQYRLFKKYFLEMDHLKNSLSKIIPYKNDLIVLKEILLNLKNRDSVIQQLAQTVHVVYLEGFIPSSLINQFYTDCSVDFPKVYIESFPTDEPAPIKFKNNAFFKPFEFIIKMFGFPRYGMIDPTPFVSICFLILFGLSFGDVIYGLLLVAFCWWGIRKYKVDQGAVNFFKIFLFAGISSTFFGALTNSWAGDLVSSTYLPKNNFLVNFKNSLMLVDPVNQIMTYMVVVLYLGLTIQMLGVFMAFMQNIKEKNIKGAIFDQVSWLIFLPCAFFFAGNFMVPNYYPSLLIKICGYGLIVSLLMIFYGGFIQSSRPVIKILKGFVNIYGIVSSYGVSAIIGDILSYIRLLALALATSLMAVSFNLISFLLKDIKIIGPILVIVLLVFTNIFNLLLSVLGAFIHPVRLMFFEFFGRFFQEGGQEYKPFSYQFKNIIVKGGTEE